MNYEIREEKEEKKARKKNSLVGFGEFWAAYPRKVSKHVAAMKWSTLNPDEALQKQIMEALENHKKTAQWKADNGTYVPYPGTWLHQRRWEDELVMERPTFISIGKKK